MKTEYYEKGQKRKKPASCREKKRKVLGEGLLSGAVLLALSGIIVKVIGLIYKIPLTNLIGDSGMGYFNSAYTIYTFFFILSTSGIPSSISLLVSETLARGRVRDAEVIEGCGIGVFSAIGLTLSLLMAVFAKPLADFIGNPEAYYGILAVSPTVFAVSVMSAVRGFFQGQGYMSPTAISQVIEALGKLLFGLLFVKLAIGRVSLSLTSALAIFGLTLGSFAALLYIMLAKKSYNRRSIEAFSSFPATLSKKDAIKKIFKISLPVTVSASVLSLASSLDLVLVMRTLEEMGYTEGEANQVFGNYSALALPIFNMPTALILPIAYAVLPFVRAALAKDERKKALLLSRSSVKIVALIAIPSSFGVMVLAKQILSLIYTNEASVQAAAAPLSVLALSIFSVSLLAISNSLLQANGNFVFPIFSMLAGIAVKLFAGRLAILQYEIMGAPIGTFMSYFVMVLLNLAYLSAVMGNIKPFGAVMKPLAASVVMAPTAYLVNRLAEGYLSPSLATLFSLAAAVIIYAVLIVLLGAITVSDIENLGASEKSVRLLSRLLRK